MNTQRRFELPDGFDPESTEIKDICWGGIRVAFQGVVEMIAADAAYEVSHRTSGSMLSSESISTMSFLDGEVTDRRGYFSGSSGMYWYGRLAKAYILYELGLDPCRLLRVAELPSHEELRRRVEEDKRVAEKK